MSFDVSPCAPVVCSAGRPAKWAMPVPPGWVFMLWYVEWGFSFPFFLSFFVSYYVFFFCFWQMYGTILCKPSGTTYPIPIYLTTHVLLRTEYTTVFRTDTLTTTWVKSTPSVPTAHLIPPNQIQPSHNKPPRLFTLTEGT